MKTNYKSKGEMQLDTVISLFIGWAVHFSLMKNEPKNQENLILLPTLGRFSGQRSFTH